jgi:RNA polymerase sigma factor (TIGR02999 family)
MSDVTRLLEAAAAGDGRAAADLFPIVYDELRRIAAARLDREKPGQTLSATGLVHEAYLRLVGNRAYTGRGHFLAVAAEAMRHILVDQARRKAAMRRGGGAARADLPLADLPAPEDPAEALAVHEALDRLAAVDPKAAELVKLRYFAGLSLPEAAGALGMAPRSADRLWAYARAWLRDAIGRL